MDESVPTTAPEVDPVDESTTNGSDSTAKNEATQTEEPPATDDPTATPEPASPPAIAAAESEPIITEAPETTETTEPTEATKQATETTEAPELTETLAATEATETTELTETLAATEATETTETTEATETNEATGFAAARSSLAPARTAAATEQSGGFSSLFTWVQRTFFNRTPTVTFDPASLIRRPDGSITGAVVGYDGDDDVLTYKAGQPANGGTVTIRNNGSFVYTPATTTLDANPVTFGITVSDHNDANGWHIHGLLGMLIAGWGSTSTTTVNIGAASASTAGSRYGWGAPRETRFTSLQSVTGSGWKIYNSAGHNGWGRRTPAAISFVDGTMVITGDAAGNTGGLVWAGGQKYGAWEVRARIPQGAADYHAVALLWPDAENWPSGGEIDFVEILGDASRQNVSHVLHYSAQNRTEYAATRIDATQWHNYGVSWTPQAITVYIDGAPTWQTTNTSHFPPGPMHLALQLDASEKRPLNLAGGAKMAVAWARQYPLNQIT